MIQKLLNFKKWKNIDVKDDISFNRQTPHTKIKENVDEKYRNDKKNK